MSASVTSSSASSVSSGGGGAPVVQGIETLTSAMSSNIIPDQEYLLQGSILGGYQRAYRLTVQKRPMIEFDNSDTHVDVLKHRLRGLCDNVDSGHDTFHEREMVFSIQGRKFVYIYTSTNVYCSDMNEFFFIE